MFNDLKKAFIGTTIACGITLLFVVTFVIVYALLVGVVSGGLV
jgi:hypothetical protein